MDKHIDAMKKSLELAETALTCLEHIKRQHSEGRFDEITILFNDALSAFAAIEKTTQDISNWLSNDGLQKLAASLRNAFDYGVSAFENKDYGKVREILQFTLIPRYNHWKSELEKNLSPFLQS